MDKEKELNQEYSISMNSLQMKQFEGILSSAEASILTHVKADMFKGSVSSIVLVLLAIFSAMAQTGQNVFLPYWVDNISPAHPYFVYFFASLVFVVVFGIGTIIEYGRGKLQKMDFEYSQLEFIKIGTSNALNGIMVVFASLPSRTPPPLQAILSNATIIWTVLTRIVILRKYPTKSDLLGCILTIIGVIVVSVPTIFNLSNPYDGPTSEGAWEVLWPFIFMFGFLPLSIMNVFAERTLKQGDKKRKVNIIYFLFWNSMYQMITAALLFWADIVPGFGLSNGSFSTFWTAFQDGFYYTFTNMTALTASIGFLTSYVVTYLASNSLLRYDAGATWLSIVNTFVTPLGVLWWNFFNVKPFGFNVHFNFTDFYLFGGAIIMLAGAYIFKEFKFKNNIIKVDDVGIIEDEDKDEVKDEVKDEDEYENVTISTSREELLLDYYDYE